MTEQPDWRETVYFCGKPRDAVSTDITLHGRQGCVPCQFDSRNLDALEAVEDVLIAPGEGVCPQCKAVVRLRTQDHGGLTVRNKDGTAHRHTAWAIPIGLEARERRRHGPQPSEKNGQSSSGERSGFRGTGL